MSDEDVEIAFRDVVGQFDNFLFLVLFDSAGLFPCILTVILDCYHIQFDSFFDLNDTILLFTGLDDSSKVFYCKRKDLFCMFFRVFIDDLKKVRQSWRFLKVEIQKLKKVT